MVECALDHSLVVEIACNTEEACGNQANGPSWSLFQQAMQFFAGCLQITSLSPAEIDEFGHAECELAYLTQGFGYWLCTVQAVSMGLWPKRCISRYLVSWCYFGPQLFGNRRNHLPMKMNNEQGAEKKMGTTRKQMCGCVPLQCALRP